MTGAPQFLELSIPAADMQASLRWYQSIGFIELPTTDARPRRYGVVSDGRICIGLHGDGLDKPGLSFVRRNLAALVLDMQDAGHEFELAALGMDMFHEARQRDSDGNLAILLEARTFSPGMNEERNLGIGGLVHVSLPCMRTSDALEFWQHYGFVGVENASDESLALHIPGLTLSLTAGTRHLTLLYEAEDLEAAATRLERDHALRQFSTLTRHGFELIAPEGTRMQLVQSGDQAFPRN